MQTSTPSNSSSDLAQRLKDKKNQDLKQVEQLTRQELEQLARNLKDDLKAVLDSTLSDTVKQTKAFSAGMEQRLNKLEKQSQALSEISAKAWLKPFLVGLFLLMGIFVGSWGMMQYLSSSLQSQILLGSQIAKQIEDQRRTLTQIEAQTWGLRFHKNKNGDRFLILPGDLKPESGWKVGDRPAIKLLKN